MLQRGFFLALEGIDGAGTTSQLGPVADYLRALGCKVVVTCEPSTQPPGVLLRRYLRGAQAVDEAAMALLFAADRLLHLRYEVLPHLQAGAVVLCDRYLWSSYAYQSTATPPLPLAWVQQINAQARPADLTLWLDVPLGTAKQRRLERGGPAEQFDHDARQSQVARAYAELFTAHTGPGEALRIDAVASRAQVTQALCGAVAAKLAALPEGTLDKTLHVPPAPAQGEPC